MYFIPVAYISLNVEIKYKLKLNKKNNNIKKSTLPWASNVILAAN